MKENVIVFVVDSARYYSTGGKDDRDKLEMMDDFENESIYFSTAVSSAPSSVMSCASMLTGLPAYYIARNYEDYKYDNDRFMSLSRILANHDYEIKSNFVAREMRDKYGPIIPQIEGKYWPPGLSENTVDKNYFWGWSNSQLNEVLENFLKGRERSRPLFLIHWYNVRLDPSTSFEVNRGIDALKDNDLWENSVFYLMSDHGYPDPKRGFTPEKLKEMNLSHDLILTDDNIRIPFYLKFPDCVPQRIDDQISTYDVLPTTLDLLGLNYPTETGYALYGKSLMNLIDGSSRGADHYDKVRTDARFFAQDNRCTSIRSLNYKYIIRHDDESEEFYDLDKDPEEVNNLVGSVVYDDKRREHREYFLSTEAEAMAFQAEYMFSLVSRKGNLISFDGEGRRILVIATGKKHYGPAVYSKFMSIFSRSELYLGISTEQTDDVVGMSAERILLIDNLTLTSFTNRMFDLVIDLSETSGVNAVTRKEIDKAISYKKYVRIDPSTDVHKSRQKRNSILYLVRTMIKKRDYYFRNPRFYFHHLGIGIRRLIRR